MSLNLSLTCMTVDAFIIAKINGPRIVTKAGLWCIFLALCCSVTVLPHLN